MSDYPHSTDCRAWEADLDDSGSGRLAIYDESRCNCHVAELKRLRERLEQAEAALADARGKSGRCFPKGELVSDNYTCEACGQTFEASRPKEDAIAEFNELFPGADINDATIVCDDCFKKHAVRAGVRFLPRPS